MTTSLRQPLEHSLCGALLLLSIRFILGLRHILEWPQGREPPSIHTPISEAGNHYDYCMRSVVKNRMDWNFVSPPSRIKKTRTIRFILWSALIKSQFPSSWFQLLIGGAWREVRITCSVSLWSEVSKLSTFRWAILLLEPFIQIISINSHWAITLCKRRRSHCVKRVVKRCGVVAAAAQIMWVHSINVFIARVSVDRSVTSFWTFLASQCELHKCMISFSPANCMWH